MVRRVHENAMFQILHDSTRGTVPCVWQVKQEHPFFFLRKGEVDGEVYEEGSFQYDWFDEGTQDSAVSLGQRRDGGGITQRQHGSSAAHRESAVYLWTGLRGAQQQSKRLPLLLRDMKRERGSIGRRAAILHPRWLVSPPDPHLMAGVMHPESNTK